MSWLETPGYSQYGTVYVNINLDVWGSAPNSDAYPDSRGDRGLGEVRNVIAQPPQVVPVRHALMPPSIIYVTLAVTSSWVV